VAVPSNAEIHRRAHDAWNRRDFDGVVKDMNQSIEYTDHARGLTIRSRDEFRRWVTDWAEFLSDGRITNPRYGEAADMSIARFTARGTNDGSFGPFPATGREAVFDLCEILRFDANGKIVGGDIYYDQLSILVQLGHVEAPAAAASA
jgi:steroid delta-isomerase-like uncharacterized protein